MRSSFVVAAALAASLAALLTSSATALERTGDPAKWGNYWDALMPVFTHPRCLNCHGATEPHGGDNHGGGPLTDDADFRCIGCHTANTVVVPGRCELTDSTSILTRPDGTTQAQKCVPGEDQGEVRVPVGPVWDNTGPDFTGMDASKLCLKIKSNMGPETLLEHVNTDPLVGFAFEGRKAIDGQSPFAPADVEPPPIDKAAFAALLTRWITEAAMACSTDGTVDFADQVTIDMTLSPSPFGGAASVSKTVGATIDINSGVATSKVRFNEKSTSAVTAPLPRCTAKEGAEVQSTAEGKPDTRYEIDIGPGGTYRMRFFLGSIEAQAGFAANEDLCHSTRRRRGPLPTEPTAEIEFGVEDQQAQRSPNDPSVWLLKGSTTVANKGFALAGATSRGERTVTWDIVIR